MQELFIDIETYSSADLSECGVYRYTEALDFAVLLFAYSVDGGPVSVVDLASGEAIPEDVMNAMTDRRVKKIAHNASFERVCLSKHFGMVTERLDPAQWTCTMVASARLGLPLSLGQCAEVLRLEEGKMTEGRNLIRTFSKPNRKGERVRAKDKPEDWETFKAYCKRDVEVEIKIWNKVKRIPTTETEERLYVVDQIINDRGVKIDRLLAEKASSFDAQLKQRLLDEAMSITGLENPNSPAQLKGWLLKETGLRCEALAKSSLEDLESKLALFPMARRVLAIRRELGKTSNKKYDAMLACVCGDGRIHGLLQFYGAARTGRWAGRLVQIQNLPQNHLPDIDLARRSLKYDDLEDFELMYAKPAATISELIRTAFVAKSGHTFHVCDFSAIEARVIAWLAGEKWVLDVFREGGDIYCASAEQMFGVPVRKHGPNAELRQKGKIAVLALGYRGGQTALDAMGAGRMGLTVTEQQDVVRLWRKANSNIVRLWGIVETAATCAIKTGKEVTLNRGIQMAKELGMLTITLPSGRKLCYPRAKIAMEYNDGWRGDHEIIEYEGLSQTSRQWETQRTYGGKLTENIVQAVARDILGEVLLRAHDAGMQTVFHIHDEAVIEAPEDVTLKDVEALFSVPPTWCKDLPLKGAGYSTPYYLKD